MAPSLGGVLCGYHVYLHQNDFVHLLTVFSISMLLISVIINQFLFLLWLVLGVKLSLHTQGHMTSFMPMVFSVCTRTSKYFFQSKYFFKYSFWAHLIVL